MALTTGGLASGQGVPSPVNGHAWEGRDREELLGYARATWHSFEEMAGPAGLPSDRL